MTIRKKRRTSWLNYNGIKLNIRRRASYAALRRQKLKMIDSGEIDIGKPIVPIEYSVITVKDGKLVCVELILPKYKKLKKYTLRFTTRGRYRKPQLYNLFIR